MTPAGSSSPSVEVSALWGLQALDLVLVLGWCEGQVLFPDACSEQSACHSAVPRTAWKGCLCLAPFLPLFLREPGPLHVLQEPSTSFLLACHLSTLT